MVRGSRAGSPGRDGLLQDPLHAFPVGDAIESWLFGEGVLEARRVGQDVAHLQRLNGRFGFI